MIKELIENCLPMIYSLKKSDSRYSITIGGSRGKELSDSKSDVDFRLYTDEFVDGKDWEAGIADMKKHMDYWAERGLMIDGVWMRRISEIENALNKWLSGEIIPEPLEWAIWGYHLPTDIYHQQIIEDPFGIAENWKKRMNPYPQALKTALFNKHMNRLKYWKSDYHYKNKVERKDIIFLASISASLVHDIMQVLCAANELYYPGDGHNLSFSNHFALKPNDFERRIEHILYPGTSDKLENQYNSVLEMISDVENIIK